MYFQVLFSRRSVEAIYVDGILVREAGQPGEPATLVGARPVDPVLGLMVPATLDDWAESVAIIEVESEFDRIRLRRDDTCITLDPYITAA